MDHEAVLAWLDPVQRDRFLQLRHQLVHHGYLPAMETIELLDLLIASRAEGTADGQQG